MPDPSTMTLTHHASHDSGIDTLDYDLAMSMSFPPAPNNTPTDPSLLPSRPDIPLPTSFPRSPSHPAQRIVALTNGRRLSNSLVNELAATIRLVDSNNDDDSAAHPALPDPYERRMRARYRLPALEEVAEGRESRGSSRASTAAAEDGAHDEDYSFISFSHPRVSHPALALRVPPDAQLPHLTYVHLQLVREVEPEVNHHDDEGDNDGDAHRLPSPAFPPNDAGSSRFRERFSLDGPGVWLASRESVVVRDAGGNGDERAGTRGKAQKRGMCGSGRGARVWRWVRRVVRRVL